MLYAATVVSEAVDVPAQAVYDFACQVDNLPQWASGLANGIEKRGTQWFAQSPMGEVEIVMVAKNELGVLDHEVKLPDGATVYNAFRVTPSGSGSVLTFTVLRMPKTEQKAFDEDVAHVRKDLATLRHLLESAVGRD